MAITRLNNNSITSVTALPSGIPTGKVLQLTHGTLGTAVTRSGSGAFATGLITSITPASTSNKIFISINIGGIRPQANTYLEFWLYRQINGGGYSDLRKMENGFGYLQTSEPNTLSKSQFYLDTTHNTTSQIDYQLYMGYQGSGSQVAINNDQQEWSTITAMEIAN
jgi:hypothetical protein